MDVLIIAEFCGDFSKTDNGRFLYLAKMLSYKHNVEIITSSFYHAIKSQRIILQEERPFKITFIKEPGYPKNICLKRFYSHYCWGKNVINYLNKRKKPDVVYCAIPALSGPYAVAKFCEIHRIRFVIDIQDLWPEAFRMACNIPVLSDLAFFPFEFLANGIYKRADAICAVSETYVNRALQVNKKCKTGTTVYLGTELNTFDRFAAETSVLVKNENEIWLAYCGTLGSSYDLKCVIEALAILKDKRIRFIVMGDGPKKDEFEQYAKKKGIKALFLGLLSYNQMCSMLCICDITVNPITHMAAQSIINKHADYAACGLPVISTQENEEYRNLVESYQMGFNCKNGDAKDLAAKIKVLLEDKELRLKMGKNARRCAEEKFDRNRTYPLLKNIILKTGDNWNDFV